VGDWPFSFTDDVRFADLDAMGHLNNVTFLAFFQDARVAYVTEAIGAHEPGRTADAGFVVAETKIAYRSPGRYGERIETLLRPGTIGRSSFSCEFEMRVGERLLAEGYAVLVAYDTAAAKPVPVPAPLRERLLADGAAVPR
jgi:acyl-CoA thioester hydrolase